MRCVIQRVSEASVTVSGDVVGKISTGLLVYLGVDGEDRETDAAYLVDKVRHIRMLVGCLRSLQARLSTWVNISSNSTPPSWICQH